MVRSSGLGRKIIQGTEPGKRKRRRKAKEKMGGEQEWPGLDGNSSQRAAKYSQRWQKIVADVISGAPTTMVVPGQVTGNNWS